MEPKKPMKSKQKLQIKTNHEGFVHRFSVALSIKSKSMEFIFDWRMIVWLVFVLGFFCGRFDSRRKMILMWVPLHKNERALKTAATTSNEFEIRYDYEEDDRREKEGCWRGR